MGAELSCAKTGTARITASSTAKMVRFFIFNFLQNWGRGEQLQVSFGAILISAILTASLTDTITFERQAPTPRMPQKACFEKPATINGLHFYKQLPGNLPE